ncbi:MAG: hypothetical protein K2O95_02860 [Clostridia bacterium]|nr:hypothetical protein [Clostridia bacterium]
MKKFVSLILILAVCASVAAFTLGCSGAGGGSNFVVEDKNFGNYDEANVVAGMSAYDLVMEAYANFVDDTNFVREEYFTFAAGNGGSLASRNTHLIRKMQGDKIYSQEVIYGTGMDKGTCVTRYYYDGEKAYEINNAAKKNVSYDGKTGEFGIKNWGEFQEFEGDVGEQNWLIKDKITTYDISSKEYMSEKHNDKVYKVGDTYYCALTINCSIEMMTSIQREAMKEFLDTLSAQEKGFVIEDTTLDFAIAQIDGKMKFKIWRRNEKYTGKHSTGISVSCEQTCLSYYRYGQGYEITSDDLLNLA